MAGGIVFSNTVITENAENFGVCAPGETYHDWPYLCQPDGWTPPEAEVQITDQDGYTDPLAGGADPLAGCDTGRCGVTQTGTGQPPAGGGSVGGPSGSGGQAANAGYVEGLPTGLEFLAADAFGGIPWWVVLLILFLIIVRRRKGGA